MTRTLTRLVLSAVLAAALGGCGRADDRPTSLAAAPAALHAVRAAADAGAPPDPDALDTVADAFIVSPSYVGAVEFPHLMHVEDLAFACAECHHETNAAALDMPRDHEDQMADFYVDCATCHHPSGQVTLPPQACSNCHPSQPRDIADETLSAKVVIHRSCWQCHDAGTGAEASETCEDCHWGERTEF